MQDQQQPFAGVKIVEFGQFVAVPFSAQLLAEGGAHVIKVESLEGDPTRLLGQIAKGETRVFISRNRGKHSLPLHLSSPAARPVIEALLEWADVALMNFRPGMAEKLELDAGALVPKYPSLIVGTVTPFGHEGPEAGLAGMDIVVQARSGLMAANGRTFEGRPVPGDPVSADYMCAMSLAFGVASALLRRERTGLGGTVDVSLMQSAMTLANNQLTRSENRDVERHRVILDDLAAQREQGASFEEQAALVPSARNMPFLKVYFRTYETADAPIAIACGSHRLRSSFITAIGLSDPALDSTERIDWTEHYEELHHRAEETIKSKPSQEWIKIISDAGVPVSAVKFPLELFDDPQTKANNMFHDLQHPTAGVMNVLSPPVTLDKEGFKPGAATAEFGSETDSVLDMLGFSTGDVDAMIADGITHRG
jgi:crotonobetainyl-CoA:carnitine CoA-transferase CaiB-like acyl-CoA transferase|tara:strand:- start:2675 stop:3946 length:1272 start_codon:yes stop_codon:yes gene_type:complete